MIPKAYIRTITFTLTFAVMCAVPLLFSRTAQSAGAQSTTSKPTTQDIRTQLLTLVRKLQGLQLEATGGLHDAGGERVFYYVDRPAAFASALMNMPKISVFAPQSYSVNAQGVLHGTVDSFLLAAARDRGVKVMPLVTNGVFSQLIISTILESPAVQERVIGQLADEGIKNGFWGWQFDFENIGVEYRDAYSAFVTKAATAFHARGLVLSVAMIARHSSDAGDYEPAAWANWSGAFDYRAIGESADFVSLMTYDQPDSKGPVAGMPWVRKVLAYAVAEMPPAKVSLGVPLYFWEWDDARAQKIRSGSFVKFASILQSVASLERGFDAVEETPWIRYIAEGVVRHLWYEDKDSLVRRLDLVTQYNLRGFSAWVLGAEDPAIWMVL